ncbi:MAG: hypothetical protein ABSH04_04060 [Acidimicrobiales bacterium]|jgi:hypothetical protein
MAAAYFSMCEKAHDGRAGVWQEPPPAELLAADVHDGRPIGCGAQLRGT